MSRPWPTELRVRRADRTLAVAFDNGESYVLPAEYLRVMTGSALDRGHGAGDRPPVAGKRGVWLGEGQLEAAWPGMGGRFRDFAGSLTEAVLRAPRIHVPARPT